MRQKLFNSSPSAFLKRTLSFSSAAILTLLSLDSREARGNTTQIPGLSIARFALPSISANSDPINPTGTPIGVKAVEIKKMLQGLEIGTASMIQATRELYEKAISEVNQYYFAAGEIEATLQLGTTPGNPKLIELRNNAFLELDQIAGTIAMMNGLTAGFSRDSEQAKALSSHIDTTLRMPGAIDEDHAHLILMSDELAKLNGAIDRIIAIINTNTERQSKWLDAERVRFASLSSAIDRGQALPSSQVMAQKQPYPAPIALPELGTHPKKVSHPQPQPRKKNVQKPQALSKSSSKSSLEPLPPTPAPKTLETKSEVTPKPLEHIEPKIDSPHLRISSNLEEKPLPTLAVAPHPKVQPVADEESPPQPSQAQATPPKTLSYSAAAKGRTPLCLLDPNQDPRSQKWYLFSAAKRGFKGPSDVVDIVDVGGKRGEEVKNLLVEMGLNPDQVRLINVKDDEGQLGKIFIFGRK